MRSLGIVSDLVLLGSVERLLSIEPLLPVVFPVAALPWVVVVVSALPDVVFDCA
jgi:hypothetical protein